jgi:hypothetical protein
MRKRFAIPIVLITALALIVIGSSMGGAGKVVKRLDTIPSGYSSEAIDVKFVEGTDVEKPENLLPADLQAIVKKIRPLFGLNKEKLAGLKAKGENRSGKKLPSLGLWFRIKLKPGTDPVEFSNRLMQLDIVETVEAAPLPAPPPQATPNFTNQQGYLTPATNGIDAEYAWTVPGGDGTGIRIYDVEYSWNQNHEDLTRASGVTPLLNSGDSASDPFSDNNHGTAVLGELIATDDTKGVTGIAHGANIGLAPANTSNLGYNPANAIVLAVADGKPGDLILLEQQTCVCGLNCPSNSQQNLGPLEWQGPVFTAIQTAVANGFIVVEAAGNGSVDLDQAACGDYFNRNHQDSGAIIVGAGQSPFGNDREREGFSCYGSRVDVQGWGDSVVTTGYDGAGDLYNNPSDPTNPNFWYTRTFGGTSSASPIVTGAAADLQGISLHFGTLLSAADIRRILVETGSPQQGNTAEHIGPRPNLWLAIAQIVPKLQVPGGVDFGDTCVGTLKNETLQVCNTGGKDLIVQSIVSSNSQFTITTPSADFPVLISSDFCFPFSAQFNPSTSGSQSATLTIATNDPVNASVQVQATGNGTQKHISTMIADSGSFGEVCTGSFKDLNLTISNSGGCDLSVSAISSSSTEFLTASTLSYPLTVQAGTSIQIPIRFQPTTPGAKSGNITVSSNDTASPSKVVSVSGTVPTGSVTVTGSTDFGNVCPGILAEKTVQVCNTGKCNLHVTSAAFVPACTDFTLVNNPFPATVSHDSCLGLTIRFTPTSSGPKSCNLVITSDDPNNPTTTLTVTANSPAVEIDVGPDQTFPPTVIQSVGACLSEKPFQISNNGSCNMTVTNVSITADASEYFLSGLPSFPITLQPGHLVGDGGLNIMFEPGVLSRPRSGTLSVTYVSDPIANTTTTVTRKLCGEGVRTGVRVLVTSGGIPLAKVDSIKLQRQSGNRNKTIVDTVDVSKNLPLQTVTQTAPCSSFQYHREYGAVSNPVQLLPGSYTVTVQATVKGKKRQQTVAFDTGTCTFNPNVVVDF